MIQEKFPFVNARLAEILGGRKFWKMGLDKPGQEV